ncbi:MAG: hypothetical protein V4615_16485 [Bacteroidota bacterium]
MPYESNALLQQLKTPHYCGVFSCGWLSGLIMKQIGEGTRKGFMKMNEALKKRAEG